MTKKVIAMRLLTALTRGIIKENPTFRLVLGMCPTLALTTSLENALGMGVAATFVLVCSNAAISALRNIIPSAVRIPCYIVVIAAYPLLYAAASLLRGSLDGWYPYWFLDPGRAAPDGAGSFAGALAWSGGLGVGFVLLGLAMALLGAVAFSGKAIIVKLAYRHGVDAITFLMLRMLLALPFFMAMVWWPRPACAGSSTPVAWRTHAPCGLTAPLTMRGRRRSTSRMISPLLTRPATARPSPDLPQWPPNNSAGAPWC